MKNCQKCGSEKIVPNAIVLDKGEKNINHGFQVAIDENPDAWIFKERFSSGVQAVVCGKCGFTEFYVTEPNDFYEAYLRSKEPR